MVKYGPKSAPECPFVINKLRCDIRDVYKLTKFIGSLEKGKYNKHKCKTETRLQTEFDMLSILWQASASNANIILGNLYSELY